MGVRCRGRFVVLFSIGGALSVLSAGAVADAERVQRHKGVSAVKASAAAGVQNQRLVASLFEMGFKPSELPSALNGAPAGGVDRALRPGEVCSDFNATPRNTDDAANAAERPRVRMTLGDCMQARELRRLEGARGERLASGAQALNNDLRSFVAAIPAWEPVEDGRVSSGFGFRRHPISRKLGAHEGTDFVTSGDRTVRASGKGVVRFAGTRGGFGKLVVVEHDYGFETRYAHLARFSVREGQRVAAGQRLGVMGSTGYSTGVHLHFELRFRDRPLDAEKALKLVRNAPALLGE